MWEKIKKAFRKSYKKNPENPHYYLTENLHFYLLEIIEEEARNQIAAAVRG